MQEGRLSERFAAHYTPIHAISLNMAEIKISIFEQGSLQRQVSDIEALRQRAAVLETERNAAHATMGFSTADSQTKLSSIPSERKPFSNTYPF